MKKISVIVVLMALTAIFVYVDDAHAQSPMGKSKGGGMMGAQMMDMGTMGTCPCGCGMQGCTCGKMGGGRSCGAGGCGAGMMGGAGQMKGMCGPGGCGCGGVCGVPGCSCNAGMPSVERIIMSHRDPIKRAFLEETKDLRKQLLLKRFEFFETARNPETPAENIMKLKREIEMLQIKISQFWLK